MIGDGPERNRLEWVAKLTTSAFWNISHVKVLREHFRTCRALIFPGEEDFGIVPSRSRLAVAR